MNRLPVDPLPGHRLSLARIAAATGVIDPVFLHSPQFLAGALSDALGCALTVKVETQNPIRSFKGRGAEFLLASDDSRAPLVCASAGNFGQAVAYACGRRGIAATVFAAREANALKVARMRALGAEVILHGDDFNAAKDAARAHAAKIGALFIEDGREVAIAEGAGTIAVELLARGDAFDSIVVPLGDGALLTGMARWIKAMAPATRVIGVVAQGSAVMERAWRLGPQARGVPLPVDDQSNTIADGIAVRVPVAESVADMHGLVDDVLTVTEASLIDAMRLLHEHVGLVVEPAGAAGAAAVLEHRAVFAGQRIATVLAGGNVTPAQARQWLLNS